MSEEGLAKQIARLVGVGLLTISAAGVAHSAVSNGVSASIDGSDRFGINGSDRLSINGSDRFSINGSDRLSINGSDRFSISGSDQMSIDGSDQRSINGSDLLARGQIDFVGDGFVSVLGQTVFGSGSGLTIGSTIAVYGSFDSEFGGFVDTQIVPLAPSGVDSGYSDFLRGTVDSIDRSFGIAVVGGMMVDYNAMLATGMAPGLGDEVAITGRNYRGLGLLVATP